MSLVSVILLSLSIVFLIIGVYESFTFGIGQGYWSLMLGVALFFFYTYRKSTGKK